MICPSLPQEDYEKFSREVCEQIRVERCEHVWAEPINIRAQAMPRTLARLRREGLNREAELLQRVHGPGTEAAWEEYARATFLAHTRNIPPDKLRYLQCITSNSAAWLASMRAKGAVLIGTTTKSLGLCVNGGQPRFERKIALADFGNRGKLTAFWGEQQAVVAFAAAACIFYRQIRISSCR